MPLKAQHLERALRNAAFAQSLPLRDQTHIDWALVILFYAAVHLIEAYLAQNDKHLRSHVVRDSYVAKDSVLRTVWKEYQDLKYYGYNARYEFHPFGKADSNLALQRWEVIKAQLAPYL